MNLARTIARAARPLIGLPLLSTAAIAMGLALAGAARAEDHPRLGLYGTITGHGYPFYDAVSLQDTTLDAVARYHEVVLDASPISEWRPDVLAALRARRPDITLLAYVTSHNIWDPSGPDSMVHYPTRYYRLVRDLGAWLYNTSGTEFSGNRVNLAKRDLFGRFVLAEGLADLFREVIIVPGIWDGIFMDVYCKTILWLETETERIDYPRAGYATREAFDAAWGAAIDTLGNRVRRYGGPNFRMVGNCTAGQNYAIFNGWMRENFPFQGGGDWYQNMFRVPDGYFLDEAGYLPPRSNFIFSAQVGSLAYSPLNMRKVRFGLGSAALGSGYHVFGPADKAALPYPFHMYWYDEYAVDLATGRSSPLIQHTGWLGQAAGPWSQMIWLSAAPDAVTNPGFETDVTSGWNFSPAIPATIVQDTQTAAVGAASARITISQVGSVPWLVSLNCANQISVVPNQPYSATFWARASQPRTIVVSLGTLMSTRITLTTEWRRYQVTLVPPAGGTAGLQLFLAEATGNLWFDDIHFQAGVSNLYRRDFQNGIVLVNPAGTAMTAPLERDFRRILGNRDLATNDGSTVTQVTVGPSDALFLIGDDRIPPAAIQDLQPGPAWTPRSTRAKPPASKGDARRP